MKASFAIAAVSLLTGALAAAILFIVLSPKQIAAPTESSQDNTALFARLASAERGIDALQRGLRSEQDSSLALQNELMALRKQISELNHIIEGGGQDKPADSLAINSPAQISTTSTSTALEADSFDSSSPEIGGFAGPRVSAEAALIEAGVDATTAQELRARLDRYTLAELEVRDTAAREGWLDSSDYRERQKALLPDPVNIRKELGEQTWSNYLLASGRNNRVRVDSVIEGSAAYNAGVEVGDLVLEYAGEAIFSIRELQQATRAGERGEGVSVRLGRGGSEIDTTLARGPLGVTLSGIRFQPVE